MEIWLKDKQAGAMQCQANNVPQVWTDGELNLTFNIDQMKISLNQFLDTSEAGAWDELGNNQPLVWLTHSVAKYQPE